jgi:lipoprotein-anchoring transpeptidase ErfK/SrfK
MYQGDGKGHDMVVKMRAVHVRATLVVGGAALLAVVTGCTATGHAPAAQAPAPVSSHALTAPTQAAAVAPTSKPTPPKPAPPVAPAACAATPAGTKHIYVSISQQHLWACTGPALTTQGPVTTGASALTNVHDATPVGTYAITSKSTHVTLAGSDVNGSWNDPVTYWMPFASGDGFHDAPWQKFPLGGPEYPTQGSHGCVHVSLPVLTQLYSWAQVGTPVTVTA